MIANLLPLLLVGVAPLGEVVYSGNVELTPLVTIQDWPMASVIVYESPYYACPSCNRRCVAGYPTFHQRYYRPPYHYRNLMDYPWHADVYPHMVFAPPCARAVEEPHPSFRLPQPENVPAGPTTLNESAGGGRGSSLRIVRSRSSQLGIPHQLRRRLAKSAEAGVSPRVTATATDEHLR